jgi:hypothetical protein
MSREFVVKYLLELNFVYMLCQETIVCQERHYLAQVAVSIQMLDLERNSLVYIFFIRNIPVGVAKTISVNIHITTNYVIYSFIYMAAGFALKLGLSLGLSART